MRIKLSNKNEELGTVPRTKHSVKVTRIIIAY
jgi:hypothetical protein